MKKTELFSLLRKRGTWATLEILSDASNESLTQEAFVKALPKYGSYYQAFLRVRDQLQAQGLIGYRLDAQNRKEIYLKPDGSYLWDDLIKWCREGGWED